MPHRNDEYNEDDVDRELHDLIDNDRLPPNQIRCSSCRAICNILNGEFVYGKFLCTACFVKRGPEAYKDV
jgi:hypothetical protein